MLLAGSLVTFASLSAAFARQDADVTLPDYGSIYRVEKRFDFDERRLGNFEDTPMHWVRLSGPGLPAYNGGRFDEGVGHAAVPSFRIDLTGGNNVAFEYQGRDLFVRKKSDYVIVAHLRTRRLRYGRAFLAAFLVDRFGNQLPGSEHMSRLVASTPFAERNEIKSPAREPPDSDDADALAGESVNEPWQKLEIVVPGDFPDAHALRLQFWILQAHVWQGASDDEIDPIIRQDVKASAWLDDVVVYRLPRARLRLTNPVALIKPGKAESFLLDVHNATRKALQVEIAILDSAGREVHRQRADVLPYVSDPLQIRVPSLPPGFYLARLRLLANASPKRPQSDGGAATPKGDARGGSTSSEIGAADAMDALLERELHFAVLAELSAGDSIRPDLGVDLGRWERGDIAALRLMLSTLRCGAIKIGVPMIGDLDSEDKSDYFRQLGELLRQLAEARIESAGVILSPSATTDARNGRATLAMVTRDPLWRRKFNPVLAQIGGLLSTWQLGDETIELRDGRVWKDADIERVRDQLSHFVTLPELVVPASVYDLRPNNSSGDERRGGSSRGDIRSIVVPAEVPVRTFPWQLGFLARSDGARNWLRLERDDSPAIAPAARMRDLARRVVLGKALGADRIYLPPPFRLTTRAGGVTWEPTEEYLVLRTLFHHLTGKKAKNVTLIKDADDPRTAEPVGIAVIFQGPKESCVVLWSWREQPPNAQTPLYLGERVRAVDLLGRPVPVGERDGVAQAPLTSTPIILTGVNAPLALLQSSFQIAPTFVELPEADTRPVLSFRNHYGAELSGTITITAPATWAVDPKELDFVLGAGETLEQPLDLTIPPRRLDASDRNLTTKLVLQRPEENTLQFSVPLELGLRDVKISVRMHWDGDDLVITHSLRNRSNEVVNFDGSCTAPGRAFAQRAFLDVAPGENAEQVYRFPAALGLQGAQVRLGVRDLGRGRRTFDEVYKVPPQCNN